MDVSGNLRDERNVDLLSNEVVKIGARGESEAQGRVNGFLKISIVWVAG